MPKILIISPEPMQAYQGGVGVYLDNIIGRVQGEDYHFDILHYANDPGLGLIGHNFANYRFSAPPLESFLEADKGRGYVQHLLGFLRDQGIKPDIVHIIDVNPVFAPLKSALAIPCVFDLHLSTRQAPDTFLWYNYDAFQRTEPPRAEIERAFWQHETECMEGAELILTHSRYYGRLTGRHRSKCVVIPNGIDLDAWGRSAPFVLPGHRPLKLVYLGRLDFMKGVDQLLSATVPPNVDLVFYGTTAGRYGGDVLAEASAREDIHYGGVLYGQEKTDMLWAADALICPSRHEPFGIVALEGLATRCLMLTSFAGGLAETIPATVGIDCGTHRQSISAALETFSIMPAADISQRTDAGSSVPRRFNWQDSANRLKGAYEHLLA